MKTSWAPCIVALCVSLALSACSGRKSSTTPTGSPDRHTVGGTVSGLVGTGLVLRNNGGDDLSIASDGAFEFVTSLAQGASYAVTVLHQPTAPAQTCTVSGGAGTMPAANVTNVSVSCSPPVVAKHFVGGTVTGLGSSTGLVLRNNGGDDLTVNADGAFQFATSIAEGGPYAVSVFQAPSPALTCAVSGGTGTVGTSDVASVVVDCQGWHASALVEFTTTNAGTPSVAADGAGNMMVLWSVSDNAAQQAHVFARRFVPLTGWEPEVLVTSGAPGRRPSAYPRVVLDDAGNGFAAFVLYSGTRNALYTTSYSVAGGWTAPVRMDAAVPADADQGSPASLVLGPSGGATVVWTEKAGYGTRAQVLASSAAAGGAFGAVDRLDKASADADAFGPVAAYDPSGKVTVAWTQAAPGTSNNKLVWVNERAPGDVWDPVHAVSLNAASVDNSFEVQLAYDGLGTAHAVWIQGNGAVMTTRRPAAASWLDPVALATAASFGAGSPRIACDDLGNATLLWWHRPVGGGNSRTAAARFDGSTWSSPTFISAVGPAGDGIGELGMAMNENGDVFAAWTQGPMSSGNASVLTVTRFRLATGWDAPLQLAGTTGSWSPEVAARGNHAMAVWYQPQSGTAPPYDVRYSRY